MPQSAIKLHSQDRDDKKRVDIHLRHIRTCSQSGQGHSRKLCDDLSTHRRWTQSGRRNWMIETNKPEGNGNDGTSNGIRSAGHGRPVQTDCRTYPHKFSQSGSQTASTLLHLPRESRGRQGVPHSSAIFALSQILVLVRLGAGFCGREGEGKVHEQRDAKGARP